MLFSICRRAHEHFKRIAIVDVDSSSAEWTEEIETTSANGTWLDRTCRALRRNDPSVKVLEIDSGENSLGLGDFEKLFTSLNSNDTVSTLILRHLEIPDAATMSLSPMVKNTNSITSLHLEESGTAGQIAAARALSSSEMSAVRVFHLKGNLIDKKGAEALGEVLKSSRTLVELRMTHNRMDAGSVACIAEGLRDSETVKILDLLGNSLNDLCVSNLSRALAGNKSLEFLCLDFNDFGYKGVQAIASMLRQNKHLKELQLFGNRIDSAGAERLADALSENSTLETLILSFNQIGDDGASALARALTVNTTLTKMWFPSNSIGSEGLQVVGAHLPKMKGLEQLHVGDFFDTVAADALLEGLKLNTRLSVLYMECPIYEEQCNEDKLDFYLRLNKSGRRLLQTSSAPVALWACALEKAGQNLSSQCSPDVLFHMLREKPDLFEFANGANPIEMML
jgi:Ran GTPase-activating protein (RanGAP) involved in mRNA processing and transport